VLRLLVMILSFISVCGVGGFLGGCFFLVGCGLRDGRTSPITSFEDRLRFGPTGALLRLV